MNDAPIQIRNPDVVRAIRQLAEESGRPISEIVGDAVRAELVRRHAAKDDAFRDRLAAIREASRVFRTLPRIGPRLTDADLYDEDGLPR